MPSKFLVPFELPDYQGVPSSTADPGFVLAYVKHGWWTKHDGVAEADLVLQRPLDGFTEIDRYANPVTAADTVLGAIEKIQRSLSTLKLTGDVTGTAQYAGGELFIETTGGGGIDCTELLNCQVIIDIQGNITGLDTRVSTLEGLPAASILSTDITNWNDAYSWGDHSLAGYLTSYTETDPVFTASAAAGILSTDITNWNTAYGWGNHASAGYITAEADTLNSVTTRGNTTTNLITVGGITATGVTSTIYAGAATRLRTEANNLVFERESSSGFMKIYINQTTLSPTAKSYMGYNNATLNVVLSNEHSTGGLELRTQDIIRQQIFANGNIVIGSSTPVDANYKLDVLGIVRTQDIRTGVHSFRNEMYISHTADGWTKQSTYNAAGAHALTFVGDLRFAFAATIKAVFAFNGAYSNNGAVYGGELSLMKIFTSDAIGQNSVPTAGLNQYGINLMPTLNYTVSTATFTGIFYNPTVVGSTGLTHYAMDLVTGLVRLRNLSGTGSRMVVADALGVLSTQAIPTGNAGTVTSVALALGTTGTDLNVSGSPVTGSGTITLNIPDASSNNRGVMTTGTQSFNGAKTFISPHSITVANATLTNGSVSSFVSSTYIPSASISNRNLYGERNSMTLQLGAFAISGSSGFNVTSQHNEVYISGGAGSTQPFRALMTTLVGQSGQAAMNIADFRYMEIKTPDNGAVTGHTITQLTGLYINDLQNATGFTTAQSFSIYQAGLNDYNRFNGYMQFPGYSNGSTDLVLTIDLDGNMVARDYTNFGLQAALIYDAVLVQDNSIDGGGFNLQFDNLGKTAFNSNALVDINVDSGTAQARTFTNVFGGGPPTVSLYASDASGTTSIDVVSTGIFLKTLSVATKTAGDVLTLVDPVSGEVEFQTPSGGSGSVKTINGNSISGTGNELVFNIDRAKYGYEYFNDFLLTLVASGASDATGLVSFFSGTGASLVVNPIPSVRAANQQGFIQFNTGTVATGYTGVYGTTVANNFLMLGGGAMTFITSVFIPTLSTSVERFRVTAGYGTTSTNVAETNGVFFTYDEGGTQNGTAASPYWQCVTVAGGVRTLITTTVLASTTAWQKLTIQINDAATSVEFYIDNVLVATHSSNIPSGASQLVTPKLQIVKTVGTTSRAYYADYIGYRQKYTTAKL